VSRLAESPVGHPCPVVRTSPLVAVRAARRRSRRSSPFAPLVAVRAARRSVGASLRGAILRLSGCTGQDRPRTQGLEFGRVRIGRFGPRFGPDYALRRPSTTHPCRRTPSRHGPRSVKLRTGAKLSGCTGQTQLMCPRLEEPPRKGPIWTLGHPFGWAVSTFGVIQGHLCAFCWCARLSEVGPYRLAAPFGTCPKRGEWPA
jgi:hypothetical protein